MHVRTPGFLRFPRTIEIRALPISLRESWLPKSLSLKRKGENYTFKFSHRLISLLNAFAARNILRAVREKESPLFYVTHKPVKNVGGTYIWSAVRRSRVIAFV